MYVHKEVVCRPKRYKSIHPAPRFLFPSSFSLSPLFFLPFTLPLIFFVPKSEQASPPQPPLPTHSPLPLDLIPLPLPLNMAANFQSQTHTLWEVMDGLFGPWQFMSLSMTFLPSTVLPLIKTFSLRTLLSFTRLQPLWFARFWSVVGPQVREGCSPKIIPLLSGVRFPSPFPPFRKLTTTVRPPRPSCAPHLRALPRRRRHRP